MPIEVQGPNGETATFPDNTPQETIVSAMRQAFGGPEQPEDVSMLESGLRGASQGITFGFGDELVGVGTGIADAVSGGSFSEGFDRGTNENRAANEAAREANPGTFLAGEIGSSILIPGAAAKLGLRGAAAAAKSGLGARSLAFAKEGAVYGGLYGTGKAEGGLADRAVGGAKGAVGGAAVGAVLPGAVDAVSGVARSVATPINALMRPERTARLKLGEAFARDLSGADDAIGPVAAIERASDKLHLQRNRWNPDGKFVGQGASGDVEMRLADVGGEATRDLLRVAANQSSKGSTFLRNTLNKRQHFQYKRLSDDLSLALGDGRKALTKIDELEELAKQQAKPLFEAAFAKQVPVTDRLSEVLKRPAMTRLHDLAKESAANAGEKIDDALSVRMLHKMKMEIDRQIGQTKRGVQDGKASWDVRTLVKLKSDLKKAIDVPEYHAALKSYSGPHALKNAIEDGADEAFSLSTHEMKKKLAGFSRDEADAYRMGVSLKISEKMTSKQFTQNKASMFETPDIQERLKVIIPTAKARRRFQRSHQLEKRMHLTRSTVQGNSTTAKQLTQGQEANQSVQGAVAAGQAVLGKLAPVANFLSRQATSIGGLPPKVAERVIRNAMNKNGHVQIQEWRKMLARAEREPQFKAELVQRLIAMGTSQAN